MTGGKPVSQFFDENLPGALREGFFHGPAHVAEIVPVLRRDDVR